MEILSRNKIEFKIEIEITLEFLKFYFLSKFSYFLLADLVWVLIKVTTKMFFV